MTFAQAAIVAILLGMLVAYASERFRVELVALCGLAVGFLTGVVPVQNVFAGFASSAVITVVEVLLVVDALSRTRVIDSFARRIVYHFQNERAALAVICVTGAGVSVFMNNIGALALMFPVTMSVCQRLGISPARMLMPLSFATLLGGMCSLTGTPANLVVNQWLIGETGRGFGYFELALLGGRLDYSPGWPGSSCRTRQLSRASPRIAGGRALADAPRGRTAGARDRTWSGSACPDRGRGGLIIHGVMREGAHVSRAVRTSRSRPASDSRRGGTRSCRRAGGDPAARLVPCDHSDARSARNMSSCPRACCSARESAGFASFVDHRCRVVGLA